MKEKYFYFGYFLKKLLWLYKHGRDIYYSNDDKPLIEYL